MVISGLYLGTRIEKSIHDVVNNIYESNESNVVPLQTLIDEKTLYLYARQSILMP